MEGKVREFANVGSDLVLSLIRAGRQAELLAVDSSTRAKMGAMLESKLRALQALADCQAKKGTCAKDWEDKASLKDGILALIDVSAAFSGTSGADIPNFSDTLAALVEKCRGEVSKLMLAMNQIRTSMREFNADTAKITSCIAALVSGNSVTLPDDVLAVVNKYNMEDQKAVLQEAVEKGKQLRDLEECAQVVLHWRADITQHIGGDTMDLLAAAAGDSPSGLDALRGVVDLMAAELLSRSFDDAADFAKLSKGLIGYTYQALLIAKKDVGKNTLTLLDNKQKASWESWLCCKGSGFWMSFVWHALQFAGQELKTGKGKPDKDAVKVKDAASMPPPPSPSPRRRSKKSTGD